MMNPWKVLNVHQRSTNEEIHESFLALAKKHHPDKKGGNTKKFAELTMAYALLKGKKERQKFLDLSPLFGSICPRCLGAGGKSKTKSITEKEFIKCENCHGAGYEIKETGYATIV